MADPVVVNQIIALLGLTGKEAEKKRTELEKLGPDELNKLLSNQTDFKKTDVSSFAFLSPQGFSPSIVDDGLKGLSLESKTNKKTYSSLEKKELDKFLGDFLFNSTTSALNQVENYNNSIGWFSLHNGVNNTKKLFGLETSGQLESRLTKEQKEMKELKDIAYTRPGAFESKIERRFNVPYDHQNVENLKEKSQEYTNITAYHEKYTNLSQGLKDLKNIIREEQEYEQAKKFLRGASAASLTPPEISSHEKFGQIMLDFCNGDKELLNRYMKEIGANYPNKQEIQKHYPEIISNLEQKMKGEYTKQLKGKNYEQYTNEYNTAVKRVIGKEDASSAAKNYIENAKTTAAYAEIGFTIASTMLLPGSSLVKAGMSNFAAKAGGKAASETFKKGIITFTSSSMPAALTAANAATSKDGINDETFEEVKEKFKNGMLYGGLGAYASGPLGSAVEKVLKAKPNAFSSSVNKAFGSSGVKTAAKAAGAAAETSADVVFDMITSDLNADESMKQNSYMNFGMMIAGGAASKTAERLKHIKISKHTDGTFTVKDTKTKESFKAKDENTLAGYVVSKAAQSDGAFFNETEYANFNKLAGKISSVGDILESPVLNAQEKEIASRLYKKLSDDGYQDFINNNPDILRCMCPQVNIPGSKSNNVYMNMDKESYALIKYMSDQYKNGKVSQEIQDIIIDRRDSQTPYEWFKYIDDIDNVPETVSSRNGDFTVPGSVVVSSLRKNKKLKEFIETQSIPVDAKAYRTEHLAPLQNIKYGDTTLGDLMKDPKNTNLVLKILNDKDNPVLIKYDNFVGTSIDKNWLDKENLSLYEIGMEIDMPKKTKGAFLDAAGPDDCGYMNFDGEAEFLLQAGSSLKIKSAQYKDGKWLFQTEVVQD